MNSAVSSLPLEDCGARNGGCGGFSLKKNLLPKLFPKSQGKTAAVSWCGFSKVSFLPGYGCLPSTTSADSATSTVLWGKKPLAHGGGRTVLMELALEGKAGGGRG